jgi:hypothetical protein
LYGTGDVIGVQVAVCRKGKLIVDAVWVFVKEGLACFCLVS